MATKLSLHQYDNGIKLLFTITNNGVVEDITGAIIRVKFKSQTTDDEFVKFAKVVDGENGEAQCVLFRKDLSGTGSYQTEVETTFANGVRLSDKNAFLPVITEEVFEHTGEVVEDIPGYTDESLE